MEALETKQQEMVERQKIARKNRRAGSKKRTRVSIKKLLVDLASHPKAHGKVRAWAIQQLLLLQGKPVQPLEDENEPRPETKPELPYGGDQLGTEIPRD
jgi:hypothetical protein